MRSDLIRQFRDTGSDSNRFASAIILARPVCDDHAQSIQVSLCADRCDVSDHPALVRYRKKRDEWLRSYELHPDEPNSTQQQILSMIFHDMAHRLLLEPHRKTDDESNAAPKSALLTHLLDQGYVATQILAIRKLLDKEATIISVRAPLAR
jgi:hypothetical protein